MLLDKYNLRTVGNTEGGDTRARIEVQFPDTSSLGSTASAWSTNLTPEQGGHGIDDVSGNIGSVVLSVGLPNLER